MTEALMQVAVEAARQGGAAIMAVQNRPRTVISKGFRDEVTDADYAAQEAIFAAIRAHHPDHVIASEEGDFADADITGDWQPPEGYWWLIDPLDGTTNFSRGVPHWGVSVGVAQGSRLIAGAIYDPNRDHMFAAYRGGGATLNGEPLHVSDRADPTTAILEAGLGRDPAVRRHGLSIIKTLATECRSVRTMGSASLALAYTAAGWIEGYIHLTLKPWDTAAGGLMIQEAGGRLAHPDGSTWQARHPPVVASNAALHETLLGLVQQALGATE